MTFWKWSKVSNNNASADSSINWAEGMAPSAVNDSARAMMAAAAKYRDDLCGSTVTSGTSTAYTVSSNQSFDTLAHLDGNAIAFTPHATNTGAVTLSVDGLTAKPVRGFIGVDLPTNSLIASTPYVVLYNNSDGVFYIHGGTFNPYIIPLGGMLEYTGSVTPSSSFIFPYGQAISRVTYANYFGMVGTKYGSGDGSTTFNVIDMRGYVSAAPDNMGGSPAGRLTGFTDAVAGGAQSVTLDATQIPSHAHTGSGTTGNENQVHTHTGSGTTSGQSADHTHNSIIKTSSPVNIGGQFAALNDGGTTTTPTSGTSNDHTHTYSFTTGGANQAHNHNFSFTTSSVGSGGSHTNIQPTIAVPKILRII